MNKLDEWASKFVGRCWHEADQQYVDECIKCKCAFQRYDLEPDNCENHRFHPIKSDSDYMELVRYAMKHEKWRAFKEWLLSEQEKRMNDNLLHVEDAVFDQMFSRELGTKAIYEFFSKEEGK